MKQWVKNVLILVPCFFAAIPISFSLFIRLGLLFLFFSFLCSAVYILNDLNDRESDRMHPVKKFGRIANSDVDRKKEWRNLIVISIVSLLGLFWISWISGIIGIIYLLNNLLYSFFFRNLPLLDLASLLFGFVLRLFLGSQLVQVRLSVWLIVLVCFLALTIILTKRRSDVLLYAENGRMLRSTVAFYKKINLQMAIVILLWFSVALFGWYLIAVHHVLNSDQHLLGFTFLLAILFALSYAKSIRRFPHKDPLILIFEDKFNWFLFSLSLALFGFTLYGTK